MELVGKRIGRLVVGREIGRGGMGSVHEAVDEVLGRTVAIKFIRADQADANMRARFKQEARAVAKLRHENVVQIHASDELEGNLYIVMEFVRGETLSSVIARRLPIPKRLELAEALCSGLHHAHQRQVIHRDVKPSNIMVDSAGVLRILDFGIARLGDATAITALGSVVGTIPYMSPEQIRDSTRIDSRSDIFSVGAVLFELMTGRRAFPGNEAAALRGVIEVDPPAVSTITKAKDAALDAVVRKALQKNVSQRYQDLAAMQRDLVRIRLRYGPSQDAGADRTPEATTVSAREMPRRSRRRALIVGGAAVAAGIAVFVWLGAGRSGLPPGSEDVSARPASQRAAPSTPSPGPPSPPASGAPVATPPISTVGGTTEANRHSPRGTDKNKSKSSGPSAAEAKVNDRGATGQKLPDPTPEPPAGETRSGPGRGGNNDGASRSEAPPPKPTIEVNGSAPLRGSDGVSLPAAVPPSAPAPPERPSDAEVRRVLQDLENAYRKLNQTALQEVWPTATTEELNRLKSYRKYELSVDIESMDFSAGVLRIKCIRRIESQLLAGGAKPYSVPSVIQLARKGGKLVVTAVDPR